MKKKTSYSFIDIFTVVVGTMVGVGIFFKNKGVLAITGNIWLALAAWVVGCLAVVGLVVGFKEISSATAKTGEAGTLSKWSRMFIGEKMSRWVGIFMVFVYGPTFGMLLCFYTYQFFTIALGIPGDWYWYLGGTLLLYGALCLANAKSYRFGPAFQNTGTIIKFIPLLLIIVLGVANPAEGGGGAFSGVVNGKPASWGLGAVFLALPGIFFALDAFLGGLPLQTEEEKKGDAFKATLYGVIITSIFYLLFAFSVGFATTDGDLFKIFGKTFGDLGAKVLYFIIGISAYTVANGMVVSGVRNCKRLSDDKDFFPLKQLQGISKDKTYPNQSLFMFIHGSAHFVILLLASVALNEKFEVVFDVWGNIATLYGFIIYALLIFAVWSNRYKEGPHKVFVEPVKHFWIALLSAFLVFGLVLVNILNTLFEFTVKKAPGATEKLVSQPQLIGYMIILTFLFVSVMAAAVNWSKRGKS